MKCRLQKSLLFLPAFCFIFFSAAAQKYNFIHFGVAEGLAQSQAFAFAQNADRELFIGTLGGFSEFDGSAFTNYNKGNGLSHNVVYDIAIDQKQNVWLATPNGISRFDGREFKNYKLPSRAKSENAVVQIAIDGQNRIWALSSAHLYQFKNNAFLPVKGKDTLLCMTLDKSGKLWVYNYPGGIFVKDSIGWHQETSTGNNRQFAVYKMCFGAFSGTLYCITSGNLKIAENGALTDPEWMKTFPSKTFVHAVLEDSRGNKWLAAEDGGAWAYRQNKWIHYDYANGFSNETVNIFFEDREGNIWLGTNGSGIYRFSGNTFTYYDRGSGLFSPSITGIAQGPGKHLFFAGRGNGLFRLKDEKLSPIPLPKGLSKINTLLTDTNGVIWIGTDFDGLWTYQNKQFRPFSTENKYPVYGIINLYESNQVIWMAALSGLFSIKNHTIKRENIPHTVYATTALGADTLMLGTLNGVYVFHRRNGTLEKQAFLPDATVLCFASDQKYLYIGTDDRGVVCWNRETHRFSKITEDSGLSCNYVYSLLIDRSGNLWVGTGCGIDEISFNNNKTRIKNFGPSDGLGGLENNANASFEDADGYLWFGTNRGLFKYNPYAAAPKSNTIKPRVVFKSIKLFSKEILPGKFSDSLLPFSTIPYNPIFPPDKNHLTFTFKGICLSSPDKIKYRYQLIGIDKQATETGQNTVVYPNLPSGHYVFKVWASDAAGDWDIHNAIEYPFTINTPFYKTLVFKIGLALLLIALLLGAVYYRNLRKSARQRWAEKMREEEQARVRQKTAEDFHDEIGNKLTRISLLTTIMESKTRADDPEARHILQQINKNIGSLYHGAKDIIWSLQPESDFLDEIIWKIRQNTEEILDGSGIHFEMEQTGSWPVHYKLPPEYSRNLIMIFKEAVNNIIKHADAKNLKLTFKKENGSVLIILRDDGKGFITGIKGEGNGLQNMQRRAERIKGKLVIESSPGKGTELRLYL